MQDSYGGARVGKLCGVEELLVSSLPSPSNEGEEQGTAAGELAQSL